MLSIPEGHVMTLESFDAAFRQDFDLLSGLSGMQNPYKKLVLEKGQSWQGSPRPKGLRRGKRGQCFSNALQLALRTPGWKYVEGFACSGNLLQIQLGMLMEHGWCLDENGKVVDHTWKQPEASFYRGIAMDPELAMKLCAKKKTYGVFQDRGWINMEAITRFAPEWNEDSYRCEKIKLPREYEDADT